MILSALCLACTGAGVLGAAGNGMMKSGIQTAEENSFISAAETLTAAESKPGNPQEQRTASKLTETEPAVAHSESVAAQTDPAADSVKASETYPAAVQTTDAPSGQTAVSTDDLSGCTDHHVYLHWDEMTADQQYFMAEIGEPPVSYHTAETIVSADEVGACIGQAYMSGCDWYEMICYHCETTAYQIKGDDAGKTIAIQFPDDAVYYLYSQDVQPLLEQPTG